MNSKLPILLLLAIASTGGIVGGQPPVDVRPGDTFASDTPASTYDTTEQRIARGDAAMLAAIATVEGQESISARLRQQINLFGQQLAGPGLYLQQGRGAGRRFRLEMSIQRSQASSTISRVCDGRFLWIYENLKNQAELKIVDLRRVRDELALASPTTAPTTTQSLAIGGLPRMLGDLQAGFQFLPVNETSLGDVAVYELRGLWRPEPLARLLPKQADAIRAGKNVQLDALPPYVPHEVVIYLGKQQHFPHRIEYHRVNKVEEGPRTVPIVTLELFEVRFNSQIDESQFGKPANLPEADYTRKFLEQLGVKER